MVRNDNEVNENNEPMYTTTPVRSVAVTTAPSGILQPVQTVAPLPVVPVFNDAPIIDTALAALTPEQIDNLKNLNLDLPIFTPEQQQQLADLSAAGGVSPLLGIAPIVANAGFAGLNKAEASQKEADNVTANNIIDSVVSPAVLLAAKGGDSDAAVIVAAALTNVLNTATDLSPAVRTIILQDLMLITGNIHAAAAKPEAPPETVANSHVIESLVLQGAIANSDNRTEALTDQLNNSTTPEDYNKNKAALDAEKTQNNGLNSTKEGTDIIQPDAAKTATNILNDLNKQPEKTVAPAKVNWFDQLVNFIYDKLYT